MRTFWTFKSIRVRDSMMRYPSDLINFRYKMIFNYFKLCLLLFRNMFPLLLALGRRLPIIGDIIVAFEGKPAAKTQENKGRPPAPRREGPKTSQRKYNPDF